MSEVKKEVYEPALRYLAGNYDGSIYADHPRLKIPNRSMRNTLLSEILANKIESKDNDTSQVITAIRQLKGVLGKRLHSILYLESDLTSDLGVAIAYLRGVKNGHDNYSGGYIRIPEVLFTKSDGDVETLDSILDEIAKDEKNLNPSIFIPALRERLSEIARDIELENPLNQEDLREYLRLIRGPIQNQLGVYL